MVEHKWIGMDEYMPTMKLGKTLEDGRDCLESDYVLVWDGGKVEIAQAVFDETGLYWIDRCAEVVKATFWMPLPATPDMKGDEE